MANPRRYFKGKINREFRFDRDTPIIPQTSTQRLTKAHRLWICENGTTLSFQLTDEEWEGLLKFLKDTRTKERLPKGGIGYGAYNIMTGKVRTIKDYAHAHSELLQAIMPEGSADLEVIKRKEAARLQRVESTVEHLLPARILLIMDRLSINLTRQKFIRLRTFCLSIGS